MCVCVHFLNATIWFLRTKVTKVASYVEVKWEKENEWKRRQGRRMKVYQQNGKRRDQKGGNAFVSAFRKINYYHCQTSIFVSFLCSHFFLLIFFLLLQIIHPLYVVPGLCVSLFFRCSMELKYTPYRENALT